MEAVIVAGLLPNLLAVRGFDQNYPDRTLDLTPYTSSRLMAAAYAPDQMLCFIAFLPTKAQPKGSVYEYDGVEPDVWEGFEAAESKGSYAIANIMGKPREAIYNFRKLEWADEGSAQVAQASPAPAVAVEGQVLTKQDTIPELPEKDEELVIRALAVQTSAKALVIRTAEIYAQADSRLTTLKAERKLVEERMNRVYDPAFKAYKEALKLKQDCLAPYDEAEKILKNGMIAYRQGEERERRAAEDAERRRLQAIEDEKAKQASKEEAEREATYAEAQGEPEVAQSIRANPVPVAPAYVPPVVLPADVPKGKSTLKENWQVRIVDEKKIPFTHEFYSLDPAKVKLRAKLKSHGTIEGALEVYDAGSIASR